MAGIGEEVAREIRGDVGERLSFEEAWARARSLEAKLNCFERYGAKVEKMNQKNQAMNARSHHEHAGVN